MARSRHMTPSSGSSRIGCIEAAREFGDDVLTHENARLSKALASVVSPLPLAEQGTRTGKAKELTGNFPHLIRDWKIPEQGIAFVILLAGIAAPLCAPRRITVVSLGSL